MNIKTETWAHRTWRIHKHTSWATLVSSYGTRAEFERDCDEAALKACRECESDWTPCLLDRADYVDCNPDAKIADDTVCLLVCAGDASEYANRQKAADDYRQASLEWGYQLLMADIGNHRTPTSVIDISDVTVHVTAPSGVYKFTDEGVCEGDIPDDVPDDERGLIEDAVNRELAELNKESTAK